MAQLTLSDINRIVMLKTCSDPDTLAQMMLASAGVDGDNDTDGECCRELLEFCKAEGIDPLPAIKIALRPSILEIKIGGTMTGGSAIQVPFTFKEQ
jgi:hypothetical protein